MGIAALIRSMAAAVALVLTLTSCRASAPQYEYEEEMYLALDGSATINVNSSIQALNALRGTAFDERPRARVDRAGVRSFFTSDATRVVFVRDSRRHNRRFVHVRLEVDDVRHLDQAAPFTWSSYAFEPRRDLVRFRQLVGGPAPRRDEHAAAALAGELVAFRIHVPSRIVYHNAAEGIQRGNILVWEQRMADRLRGEVVEAEVRMGADSILAMTLGLFAGAGAAVAALFAIAVWWIKRRGALRAIAPKSEV
jgi:hypothetical protein